MPRLYRSTRWYQSIGARRPNPRANLAAIADIGEPADLLLEFLGVQRRKEGEAWDYFWELGALLSSCKAWARHGDGAWAVLCALFEGAIPSPLRLHFATSRSFIYGCLVAFEPSALSGKGWDYWNKDYQGTHHSHGLVASIAEGPAEGPAPGPHAARPTSASS